MRRPEPWYWDARQAWYVQINGKQKRLAPEQDPKRAKDGKPVPSEAAMLAYHRLMAIAGRPDPESRADALVPEVAEVFLGTRSDLAPTTLRRYRDSLKVLCAPYLQRKFSSLRPADVEQALARNTTWGDNTRHDFCSTVWTLFQWAKDSGYTTTNTMAGYTNPYPRIARTRVMTDEEFRMLLDAAMDLEFKQIMQFLRGTACRPGEARKITAAHVDPERPIVVLSWREHKTGKKTKKSRLLYMPKDVETMVRSLMERHPTGPLFRNSRNGGGWREWSLASRVRAYRRKLGLGEDLVPYTTRHTTLSRLLDNGLTIQQVAAIAGHSTTNVLMNVYYHPDQGQLLDGVDKAHPLKKQKDA